MTKRRLTVIPKPGPASGRLVMEIAAGGLQGTGPVDLVCGVCDELLAGGVPSEDLRHFRAALVRALIGKGGVGVRMPKEPVVLKCPACGAYNESTIESP